MPALNLERLAAEDEITRLLLVYCTGIDTGRLDDTAELSGRETSYLTPGTPLSGIEDVARFLKDNGILYAGARGHARGDQRPHRPRRRFRHGPSPVLRHRLPERPGSAPGIIFQGAYDAFAHFGSSWHFTKRRILTDGPGDMSRHLKGAQPVPAGTR